MDPSEIGQFREIPRVPTAVEDFRHGLLNGAAGVLSFPQFLSGSAASAVRDRSYAIVAFVGGAFGGPGDTSFLSLLFLFLVIIVTAVIVALAAAFLLHLLLYGVAGAAKGGTKAYIIDALQDARRDKSSAEDTPHPVVSGLIRGFAIGSLTGLIEAAFTTLAIVQFYDPSKH